MKEKQNKPKTILKAGGILSTLVIGIVIGLLGLYSVTENITNHVIVEKMKPREWNEASLGQDLGSGLSSVVNVSLVKHGLYDYTDNITRNASMFACRTSEINNSEIGDNVPYGVKFDIVVKVVWNKTMMYNTTSKNWSWQWVNATIAITMLGYTGGYPGGGGYGFNISSEWNISDAAFSNDERVWGHYVFGAAGGAHSGNGEDIAGGNNNGLSINKSQRVPTAYFKFFAYY